jgi:hypothetical protein
MIETAFLSLMAESCENGNKPLCFIKSEWYAEWLRASQRGLSQVELVINEYEIFRCRCVCMRARVCGSAYFDFKFNRIMTDLLKALLGNGSVKTFQHTRHATIRWKCFLCGPRHATILWKCFLCVPRHETIWVLCFLRGPCRVYVAKVIYGN